MREYLNDGLIIRFKDPSIQPFGNDFEQVKTMKDVMHYYYTIEIDCLNEVDSEGDIVLAEKKTLFKADAYDFPKVQNVPAYINYIIEEPCNLVLEDFKKDEFHRIIKYNQVKLEDMNVEYWYKFERYDYSVKQSGTDKYNNWTEYTVTIGQGNRVAGYSSRKEYGNAVYIDKMTEKDLLDFKQVVEDFILYSIDEHNSNINKVTTICPNCRERINIVKGYVKNDKYKCYLCEKEFDNDFDEFYDYIDYGDEEE